MEAKVENVLSGDDAFELYSKGRKSWNHWVDTHPACTVDFSNYKFIGYIDFGRYKFHNGVNFSHAQFGKGNVDFSHAQFGRGDVDFSHAQFGEGNVDFSEAQFGEGDVDFSWVQFGEGKVDFREAQFDKGDVDFSKAQFDKGKVDFFKVQFRDGKVNFIQAQFGEGDVNFYRAQFGEGDVDFTEAQFGEGRVSFFKVQFEKGYVDFTGTKFGEGELDFFKAQFGDGGVCFFNVQFGEGDVDFTEARFGVGGVDFNEAQFGVGDVAFIEAQFGEGDVAFIEAQFGEGDVDFSHVQFGKGEVDFSSIEVNGKFSMGIASVIDQTPFATTFQNAIFNGGLYLDGRHFKGAPDFRHAKIDRDVSMDEMQVSYETVQHNIIFKKSVSHDDTHKYCKLKSIALEAKNHDRAMEFLSLELRSKYAHHLNGFFYFPIFMYGLVSSFGRSIIKPLACLALTWALASMVFFKYGASQYTATKAMLFSFSNLLPFIPWSKNMKEIYQPKFLGTPETYINELLINSAASLEGLLALIWVFLIGLAFRNMFKI